MDFLVFSVLCVIRYCVYYLTHCNYICTIHTQNKTRDSEKSTYRHG